MNRVDLHPEDLFDRARRGEASPEEARRLHAHLESCRACRFEYTLALDCAEGAADLPGDDALLARIRAGAARELRRGERRGHSVRTRRRPARVLLLAAAAVVLLATLTAGATFARRVWTHTFARNVESTLTATPPPPAIAKPAAPSAPHDTEPEVVTEPAVDPPEPARPAPRAAAQSAERSKPVEPPASAADLFARANLARRQGDVNEAAHTYRELQASYPGSSEELVSRVTLGRLLLDRLGDARGALVQFDSYLANPTHGALREEALIGRALSLGRLRRQAEEKSAWAALLAAYPKSAYAERARARLEELR
jgi:hypothetical protein